MSESTEFPETWVSKWYMPRASVSDLTSRLEGAPDGAFYVCDDNVENNVFHIVYRFDRTVWEAVVSHRLGEGYHIEDSEWFFGHLAQLVSYYCHELVEEDLPAKLVVGPWVMTAPAGKPWTVEQVSVWLRKHGHDRYVETFARHLIDGPALLQIQDMELRNMGITDRVDREALLVDVSHLLRKILPAASRKKTFAVKQVNGQIKIVDADTNEEVHELGAALIREISTALASGNGNGGSTGRRSSHVLPEVAGDEELPHQWWQVGAAPSRALAELNDKPDGFFIVRDSPGDTSYAVERTYILSFNCNGEALNEFVVPTVNPTGYALEKAPRKVFRDLDHLLDHFCSKRRAELPVQLRDTRTPALVRAAAVASVSVSGRGASNGGVSSHSVTAPIRLRSVNTDNAGDERLTALSQSQVAQSIRAGSDAVGTRESRGQHYNHLGPPGERSSVSFKNALLALPRGALPPPGAVPRERGTAPPAMSTEQPQQIIVAVPKGSAPPPGAVGKMLPQSSVSVRPQSLAARPRTVQSTTMSSQPSASLEQQAAPLGGAGSRRPVVAGASVPYSQYEVISGAVPEGHVDTAARAPAPTPPVPTPPVPTPVPRASFESQQHQQQEQATDDSAAAATATSLADWLRTDLTRLTAIDELTNLEDGEFLVHSSGGDAFLELTLVYQNNYVTKKIQRSSQNRVALVGSGRPFASVPLLVEYYQSDEQRDLPMPLAKIRVSDI